MHAIKQAMPVLQLRLTMERKLLPASISHHTCFVTYKAQGEPCSFSGSNTVMQLEVCDRIIPDSHINMCKLLIFQECRCTLIVYLSQEGSYPLFGLTLTGKWAAVVYKHWLTDSLFITFTLWCLCTVLDDLSYLNTKLPTMLFLNAPE